jgi:hypothetical protein
MSPKVREIARRIPHNVETACWAAFFAFVVYFTIFVLPKMSEFQSQRVRVEAIEIAAENASLCEKLHIKRGSNDYNQCLLDVGESGHVQRTSPCPLSAKSGHPYIEAV